MDRDWFVELYILCSLRGGSKVEFFALSVTCLVLEFLMTFTALTSIILWHVLYCTLRLVQCADAFGAKYIQFHYSLYGQNHMYANWQSLIIESIYRYFKSCI